MGIACKIFGHKWKGCKCSNCGIIRDEEHQWNGCKCTTCGAARNENHSWNGCKCTTCDIIRSENHSWDDCAGICTVCGMKTTPLHTWDGCACTKCGATKQHNSTSHKWNTEGVCTICGYHCNHNWVYCTCTFCNTHNKYGNHRWTKKGDICEYCGEKNINYCEHDLQGCICVKCKRIIHKVDENCKCERCGEEAHSFKCDETKEEIQKMGEYSVCHFTCTRCGAKTWEWN